LVGAVLPCCRRAYWTPAPVRVVGRNVLVRLEELVASTRCGATVNWFRAIDSSSYMIMARADDMDFEATATSPPD
jgi:hypothetical protein